MTDTKPKHPGGRPTLYTDEIAGHICAEIAGGAKIGDICEPDEMPHPATVYRWLGKNSEFCEQYARAQSDRSAAFAEEIVDIADDGRNDWMEKHYGDRTEWVVNGEALQRSRLRVDTRKWLMSKMTPMKYGDVIKQVHQGPDGKALNTAPTIIFTGSPPDTSPPKAVGGPADDGD